MNNSGYENSRKVFSPCSSDASSQSDMTPIATPKRINRSKSFFQFEKKKNAGSKLFELIEENNQLKNNIRRLECHQENDSHVQKLEQEKAALFQKVQSLEDEKAILQEEVVILNESRENLQDNFKLLQEGVQKCIDQSQSVSDIYMKKVDTVMFSLKGFLSNLFKEEQGLWDSVSDALENITDDAVAQADD